MGEEKIKTLEELSIIIDNLKNQDKKIVHCHGVFDIVHFGHISHFLDAKKQGDVLIITITPDRFIQKGPGRPIFNEDIRIKHLASIECINYAALNKWDTAVETIKLLKPNFYCKGKEVLDNKDIDKIKTANQSLSNLQAEEQALREIGGKLHLTDEITFSSSKLINELMPLISEESKKFLSDFKQNFTTEDLIKILESLKDLRVIVIGEAILDEYVFCKALDKVGREPMVAYKFLNSETYLGGSLAVVGNLINYTQNVSLITCIGNNSYEFIETNLNKNIERNIFIQNDIRTMVKKRYIDFYKNLKMYEIYNTEEININEEAEDKIIKYLDENLSRFDIIIVSDFGHGMISPRLLDYLCHCNKFLAVNCQLNAGNFGYNFITKYKRADFVSLNEKELRLPIQEKTGDIKIPLNKLSDKLKANKITITLGPYGSIYYSNGKYFSAPAFIDDPVDIVGASDSILSLSSLLAYKNSPPQTIPFLNNCLGALTIKTIGNKKQVSLIELKKFISYIMK